MKDIYFSYWRVQFVSRALSPHYTNKRGVCQERRRNLFDRCRKKMLTPDKNAYTLPRFVQNGAAERLFLSFDFS